MNLNPRPTEWQGALDIADAGWALRAFGYLTCGLPPLGLP